MINELNEAKPEQPEWPTYICHKQVKALEIRAVDLAHGLITPADKRYAAFYVGSDYLHRHKPEAGGYFVRYSDGYESFSPKEAFEQGYTLVG